MAKKALFVMSTKQHRNLFSLIFRMYHTNARKVAESRGPDITVVEPSLGPGDEPWDRDFLFDVLDLVISVRIVSHLLHN